MAFGKSFVHGLSIASEIEDRNIRRAMELAEQELRQRDFMAREKGAKYAQELERDKHRLDVDKAELAQRDFEWSVNPDNPAYQKTQADVKRTQQQTEAMPAELKRDQLGTFGDFMKLGLPYGLSSQALPPDQRASMGTAIGQYIASQRQNQQRQTQAQGPLGFITPGRDSQERGQPTPSQEDINAWQPPVDPLGLMRANTAQQNAVTNERRATTYGVNVQDLVKTRKARLALDQGMAKWRKAQDLVNNAISRGYLTVAQGNLRLAQQQAHMRATMSPFWDDIRIMAQPMMEKEAQYKSTLQTLAPTIEAMKKQEGWEYDPNVTELVIQYNFAQQSLLELKASQGYKDIFGEIDPQTGLKSPGLYDHLAAMMYMNVTGKTGKVQNPPAQVPGPPYTTRPGTTPLPGAKKPTGKSGAAKRLDKAIGL